MRILYNVLSFSKRELNALLPRRNGSFPAKNEVLFPHVVRFKLHTLIQTNSTFRPGWKSKASQTSPPSYRSVTTPLCLLMASEPLINLALFGQLWIPDPCENEISLIEGNPACGCKSFNMWTILYSTLTNSFLSWCRVGTLSFELLKTERQLDSEARNGRDP